MDELLNILAHGNDAQIAARVYCLDPLSDAHTALPLNLLRALKAPTPASNLEIVERYPAGRFELLILRLPWKQNVHEPGSGYHPLLVAHQNGQPRALGFLLPWSDLIKPLGTEMAILYPLSLIWINRLMAFKNDANTQGNPMPTPTPYWFPAKRHGYGWGPPATWQGWLVLLAWLAILLSLSPWLALQSLPLFFLFLTLMVALLITVYYAKGEPPRWR